MGNDMAAKLLIDHRRRIDQSNSALRRVIEPAGLLVKAMNRESQVRSVAVLLFLLTVAAVVFAGFNFNAEWKFLVPDDGVWWVEHGGRLTADRVDPERPRRQGRASRRATNWFPSTARTFRACRGWSASSTATGVWSKASYSLLRQSVPLDSSVILVPAERSLNNWLRLIALIYLGIGLYVLLRRWTAPGSTHFYIFCLVSFIAYSFKYTGKLNDFDWTIYWGNIAAGVLQPALFLHFVLTFPEKRADWCASIPGCWRWSTCRQRFCWPRTSPPCVCLQASERLRWNLDRMEMSYGVTVLSGRRRSCSGIATGTPALRFCGSS